MADDILPLLGVNEEESDESGDEIGEEDVEFEDTPQSNENSSNVDISYDQTLPTQHSYLGTDLEELSGRTILDETETMELPLLSFHGVVLIPGQTLPLRVGHPSIISMLREIIGKNRTFGMVVKIRNGEGMGQMLASVGTTAEIRSYKEENDENSFVSYMSIKAEGRQRFKLVGTPRRRVDGILVGKVCVLPEILLGDPGSIVRPSFYRRYQLSPPPNIERVTSEMGTLKDVFVLRVKSSRKKYEKYQFSDLTPWPSWVYHQYDTERLLSRMKMELQGWSTTVNFNSMPSDPSEFSFWVAANLPLDDSLKVTLLTIDCVVQRLRAEMSILDRYKMLYCRECGKGIVHKEDLFSLSLVGPQGTYVNPGGYVHETITVVRVKNLRNVTLPSTEHSWFPGYSWTIVNCKDCNSHMGWKFSTSDEKVNPRVFWGLCRKSLLPGILPDQDRWQPTW